MARFGRPVKLSRGPRLELLNAKAVITEPAHDSAAALARYGFELERFLAYQRAILRSELPEDVSYTYGNRLRAHPRPDSTTLDTLHAATHRLRTNPSSRHAYVTLWDNVADLEHQEAGSPCLVTLFFRQLEGSLALTATYRSHNLLSAWLENVYGLMAIQRHVADQLDLTLAPLTVISHSLGIDPNNPRYALARRIAERWKRDDDRDVDSGKYSLRVDPNGYFVVSVDEAQRCIVAEHRAGGVLVKRYRGRARLEART